MKAGIRKVTMGFVLTTLVALPLTLWPSAKPADAIVDKHVPVAKYGTVKVTNQVNSQSNVSKAYVGTGKPVSNSKIINSEKVAPASNGMVSIQAIIGTDDRTRVTNTTTYPYRAIAHIESDIGGCTGWFIGPDTVVTAGHCIYNTSTKRWASYARVYPGRNGSNAPYGYANAINFYSVSGWVNNGDPNYDYGAIKLDRAIGNTTGWFGYRYSTTSLDGTRQNISGYPGDKTYGTQWQHADQIRQTASMRLYYQNDTYGGQSGSPVYEPNNSSCGGPCGLAVHAYGGSTYNSGTRITQAVFNNFNTWKNQ